MAYVLVKNGRTEYAIDWDFVHRLLRSYYTAVLQYQYATEVTISESRWYNPFSYSLPDVSHVEVDWPAVRSDAQSAADREFEALRREANTNARNVAYTLDFYVDQTAHYKELFVDWMGDVQTENMERINKAVDAYDSQIEVAKFFRDRSADGLMVGASFLSGGAAVAVMGGGSILKGTGKFEDAKGTTAQRATAGAMEAVGSFVFAYVKLGKKFSFKQDMVLALVQAPYKMGTELVAGDTFGKAALSGALKLTGPSVDRLFKLGPAKTLFEKVAMPINIWVPDKVLPLKDPSILKAWTDEAPDVIGKSVAKFAQSYGVEKFAKNQITSLAATPTTPPPPKPPKPGTALVEQATLSNKTWLKWAIVNMELGIGRGW